MEIEGIYKELNRRLEEPRLRKLYRSVRTVYREADPIAHNWEHIRRDLLHALWIGLEEGADMGIVLPAAILHDLGYITHPHDPRNHPVHGSRECFRFLEDWSGEEQEKISACILKHKGKYPEFEHEQPETLEEKVVCDADQVDKFGWVGFMQMTKVYTEYGYRMNIQKYKTLAGLAEALTHIQGVCLYTETAKRLAAERREPDFLEISRKLLEGLTLYENWKEQF